MAPQVGAMAPEYARQVEDDMATVDHPATEEPHSAVTDLSGVLLTGLKALADAGEVEQACRLAGRACAILRRSHGDEWRGFNNLLHRLARRAGPVGAPARSSRLDCQERSVPASAGLSKE
jgi:hypothetical protein